MVNSFKNYDKNSNQEVSVADFKTIMRDMGYQQDMTQ